MRRCSLDSERAIINIGSVGRSFCDPRLACYVLVDRPADLTPATVTFRAVPYPVQTFIDKLRACGVPVDLAADRECGFEGSHPDRDRIVALYRDWYPEDLLVSAPA